MDLTSCMVDGERGSSSSTSWVRKSICSKGVIVELPASQKLSRLCGVRFIWPKCSFSRYSCMRCGPMARARAW